jgi:calcium-translocating P-type ATPase
MLQEKVLVRKLLGIETAGSLDLLFTDKTGTLTRGKLEAQFLMRGDGKEITTLPEASPAFQAILQYTILGNSFAAISAEGEVVGGNSSERAVVQFLPQTLRQLPHKPQVLQTIAFDSARKFSATCLMPSENTAFAKKGETLSFVKGATEIVLANCAYFVNEAGEKKTLSGKESLLQKADALADRGVRLLALAYTPRKLGEILPENMVLVGLMAIRDETRPEASSAVIEVQNAGIQVVMITGDRKGTAKAIAQEVGLYTEGDVVLTSKELNALPDKAVAELLPRLRVVARALPTDKSRLVRIAQGEGRVVGMTGDGVNDAAALKQADVGFAMGSGSEVAKEAGDIVILDDNFSSIANAVRYGRTIFKSIRKFIVFQLTVNLAAVGTAFLGPFFGVDFPLTILQILWINIIMDTLAAIALGGEPALRRFMQEKPVQRTAHILSSYMRVSVLTGGLYITALSMLFLSLPFFKTLFYEKGVFSKAHFFAGFFNLFIFLIFFNAFNARTERINLLDNLNKNKGFLRIMAFIAVLQVAFTFFGGEVLRTVPLALGEWAWVLGLAFTIIPLDLLKKKVLEA